MDNLPGGVSGGGNGGIGKGYTLFQTAQLQFTMQVVAVVALNIQERLQTVAKVVVAMAAPTDQTPNGINGGHATANRGGGGGGGGSGGAEIGGNAGKGIVIVSY